ncbi:TPA: phage tail protein [Citrobacter freundii]|nr:phage tail protein [Citrobacter freundii]HCA1223001.1 phage tail protein [Citrobacter freundii]HCA1840782.1 phage tail protein [Citrobacter freundii]
MANLPETPQWEDGIYQIEVSDPVLGGPDGISNRQAKQLAKRTSYLKQQVENGDKDLADHIAAPNPHTQYAPKESPALTGTPTAPTAIKTDNSTKLATTGHVKNVVADYAPLASPGLTGKPTAPTAAQASNDTQLATTAFVKAALAALVASSPEALDTLNELAAALGNDPNFATTMTNALAGKQPLDSTLTALSGKSVSALLEYLQLGEAAKRDIGSGAGQVPDMSSFQSGGGWFKLPSGYVIQAFEASFDSNGLYINFPIPFPSSVIAIVPGVLMSTTASPSQQFPSIQRDVNDLTRFFAKYNIGGMNASYFIAIGK